MNTLTSIQKLRINPTLLSKAFTCFVCLALCFSLLPFESHAQCPLQSTNAAATMVGSDTVPVVLTTCASIGENALLSGVDSGQTYAVAYSSGTSNVYITIYDENDSLVSDAFGDTMVTFTATSSGTYKSSATDSGGTCSNTDTSCYILTATCLTCPDFICDVPANPFIDTITLVSASLRWDSVPGAEHYLVTGNAVGQLVGQFSTTVSENSFEFVNLNPGISYWWSVRTVCDSINNQLSDFTVNDTFETPVPFVCQIPDDKFTDSITATMARLNWAPVDGAVAYNIVGNEIGTTQGQFDLFTGDTSLLIQGLTPGVSYIWSIRTFCDSAGTDVSDFSGNLTFTTLDCAIPDSLSTSDITENSALISWDTVAGAIAYNIIGNIVGDSTSQVNVLTPNTSYTLVSLVSDTAYWWSVRAICDSSGFPVSAFAINDTFQTLPPLVCEVPANLSTDSATSNSIIVSWDSVPGAIAYNVTGNAVGDSTVLINTTITSTELKLTLLAPDTAYWWSVRAICDLMGNASDFAENDTFSTLPLPLCPTPQNPAIDTITPNSATLTWNAVSLASSYNVIGNAVGAISGQFSITVSDTTYTLAGLNPEISYWWSVRSICDTFGNSSAFTANDTFVTPSLITCSVPQNLNSDNITTTSVIFTWDTVPGAVGYRVVANVVGMNSFFINVTPTVDSFQLTGLMPGTAYWWSVRAICDLMGDVSEFAENDTFTTLSVPSCQIPQNRFTDSIQEQSAILNWDTVPGAIGYRVRVSLVGNPAILVDAVTPDQFFELNGLSPDTSYYWSVRAICDLSGNSSAFSANDTFTTMPLPECQIPQNLSADSIATTSVTFNWDTVPNAIGYRVVANVVGMNSFLINVTPTENTFELTGLSPGTSYWWSVRAICDLMGDVSEFAENDTFTTAAIPTCQIPQNRAADSITFESAILTWDSVSGAIGYRVQASLLGNPAVLFDAVTPDHFFELNGLSPDTSYYWSVRAICDLSGNSSAFSANDTFTTMPLPECQIPQNLSADSIATTSVTFNWDTVPNAIGYRVVANVVGMNSFFINVTPTNNTFELTGLSPGTSYWWSVRAICDLMGDVSDFAENDTFTTATIPTCQIPQNRSADSISFENAILNWDSVSGAIGYRVQASLVGNPAILFDAVTPDNFFELNGLSPDTAYYWSVRSICDLAGNSSPFSANDTFTTLPSPGCQIPQNLSADNITVTTATVSWDAVTGAIGYRLVGNVVGSTDTLVNIFLPTTTQILTALNPDTEYWFTVRAICDLSGDVSPFAVNDTFATLPLITGCTDPTALNFDSTATVDDSSCVFPIFGCTDPTALNFDSTATVDDSSCIFPIFGCTDPTALNFDSTATVDDSSCVFPIFGCTDPTALNFDSTATVDDSSCVFPIFGCTDPTALNFDSTATVDDSSCIFPIFGCTDPAALNFDSTATVDDSSCVFAIFGCTDPTALNFDSTATVDDSSCIFPIFGCTDPAALNFDSTATVDDSSCIFPIFGCTDPTALNFDSTATVDDSSCVFGILGCTDPMALNFDSTATIDDSSCLAPIAGGKDVQQTSASLVLDGDTVVLTGTTIIRRSDAFLNNDGKAEIPLDMESMCLEGSHPVYGNVRINAGSKFGLQSSTGVIVQMNPGASLTPVSSQIELYAEIEIENIARTCSGTPFVLNGAVSEVPICSGSYAVDTPFTLLTECCTGDTLTQSITAFTVALDCNLPAPVATKVTSTMIITVNDSSFNTGVVRLDLVKDGDCESVVFSSGDVVVGNEQMASTTANALATAMMIQAGNNPDCAAQVTSLGNTLSITSDFPYEVSACLKGSDQSVGAALMDTTIINLGQKFSGNGSTKDTSQNFSCVCEPSNDLITGAISIGCGDTLNGTTIDATSIDNPNGCGVDAMTPGVWYQITGTGDSITASLCGTSFNTYLAVFEEVAPDSFKCFAFNDDFCGLQSEASWLSQSGKNYKIFVTGVSGSTGDFSLAVNCVGNLCVKPALIWSDNISNSTVTLHWTEVQGVLGYEIQGNAIGGAPLVITVPDPTITTFEVRNLPAGLTFEWRIRSICDGGSSVYSAYTEFNNFQTLTACPKPGPISTTVNSSTSATLNWTPVNQALAYRIAGGVAGGSIVTLTVPGTGVGSLTVNNLTPGLTYGWTVKSLCFSNSSLNVTPIEFFTLPVVSTKTDALHRSVLKDYRMNSISELTLYPNPTTGLVTLEVNEIEGHEKTEIYLIDLSGKIITLEASNRSGSGNITLDLSYLDSGIYTLVVQSSTGKSIGKLAITK